jgi:hypothetical protein
VALAHLDARGNPPRSSNVTAISCGRFPLSSGCGLPHLCARSASTLVVSRPAQRSLAFTACRLAASPKRHILVEGSDGFVTSTRRSDSYRLERPVAGWELHPLKNNIWHGAQQSLSPRSPKSVTASRPVTAKRPDRGESPDHTRAVGRPLSNRAVDLA